MTTLRLPEVNLVVISGRLTRDPDFRSTSSGTGVCNFSFALSRRYQNKQGEWVEEPTYLNAVVWGEALVERCKTRLKKGSPVLVQGSLRSREWENKEGQKRKDVEIFVNRIQFLEKMGKSEETSESEEYSGTASKDTSEEIPF